MLFQNLDVRISEFRALVLPALPSQKCEVALSSDVRVVVVDPPPLRGPPARPQLPAGGASGLALHCHVTVYHVVGWWGRSVRPKICVNRPAVVIVVDGTHTPTPLISTLVEMSTQHLVTFL